MVWTTRKSDTTSGKFCNLRKSLYALEQSPPQWYAKMHDFLFDELGFKSSSNAPCLYTHRKSSSILLTALYVDDLVIAGSIKGEAQSIKNPLSTRFERRDLGLARVMLRMQISRDRAHKILFIIQSEYYLSVLERFVLQNSRTVVTPMEKSFSELSELPSKPALNVPYCQVVGSLMWLMIGSRPDLASAIGKLNRIPLGSVVDIQLVSGKS